MMRRCVALLAMVVAVGLLTPAPAHGLLVWLLTATPLTAQTNAVTTFTLTATNLDLVLELGCLEVNVPGSGAIVGTGTPVASNGDEWISTVAGNAVVVYSRTGGGRLETGEWVTFTIDAKPPSAGTWIWANHAHDREDCTGPSQPGAPIEILVTPGPTPTQVPTPTPAPTPPPTPLPTPPPTPTPLPVPSLTPLPTPLPLPTVSLPPLPTPLATPTAAATPTPHPVASESPGDTLHSDPSTTVTTSTVRSPAPEPSSTEVAALVPDGGGGPPPGGIGLRAASPIDGDARTDVGVELFTLLGGAHVWFVPAAAIGVPGLLVVVWVALQAIGALAWIPAVRRMSGDDRPRRKARPTL